MGGGNSLIVSDSDLIQIFDADRSDPQTIRFRALEPWTATLEEVTRAVPEWIELSSYGGEAGDVALTIRILRQNTTDASRHAKITIRCGSGKVEIEIEQKGTSNGEDPDNPAPDNPAPGKLKYVKSVKQTMTDEGYDNEERMTQSYTYDEQHRIVRIDQAFSDRHEGVELESDDSDYYTFAFDHTTAGRLSITVTDRADKQAGRVEAELDSKGRVTKTKVYEREYGHGDIFLSTASNYFYYEDGRLSGVLSKYSNYPLPGSTLDRYMEETFYYTDGLLTRALFSGTDESDDERLFPADRFYPNRLPSGNSNIDFFYALIAGEASYYIDDSSLLFPTRYAGRMSDALPEVMGIFDDSDALLAEPDGWHEPDVVIPEEYFYSASMLADGEAIKTQITMDGDNCVTHIYAEEPYAKYRVTYDRVVGHELLWPEMAEWPEEERRYKWTIQNRKETKVLDYKHILKIEVEYL